MKNVKLYYLLLAAILVGKTITTIYERSVVIHHGNIVVELQQEKQSLKQREATLLTELSQKNSLAAIQTSADLSSYTPIDKTVVIGSQTLTASQF